MQPWEQEKRTSQPCSVRSIAGAISHVGFGLGLAVLIYGTVIYQAVFMKNNEEQQRKY